MTWRALSIRPYGLVAVLRLAVYLAFRAQGFEEHWMADHVLLGASVVAAAHGRALQVDPRFNTGWPQVEPGLTTLRFRA